MTAGTKRAWIDAALVFVIVLGLVDLGRAWLWSRPDAAPARNGTADVQRELPELESELAERLGDIMSGLEREPTALHHGRAGQIFDYLGRPADARTYYEAAVRLDPDDHRWPHYLGRLAARAGDWPRAEREFRRAIELAPDFAYSHGQLADVYLQTHQLEAAEASLAEMVRLAPDNPYGFAGLGRVALARGEAAQAVTHLALALALEPDHGEVHALLGRAYTALGDDERAEAHRRRAGGARGESGRLGDPLVVELLVNSNSIRFLKVLARQQHARRNWPKLVETLEELARREPSNPAHVMDLAGTYLVVGRIADARRAAAEGIARRPDDPRAHEIQARVALTLGAYDAALAAAGEALRLDEDYEPGYRAQAVALAGLGRLEEALQSAEVAARLAPDSPEVALLIERLEGPWP